MTAPLPSPAPASSTTASLLAAATWDEIFPDSMPYIQQEVCLQLLSIFGQVDENRRKRFFTYIVEKRVSVPCGAVAAATWDEIFPEDTEVAVLYYLRHGLVEPFYQGPHLQEDVWRALLSLFDQVDEKRRKRLITFIIEQRVSDPDAAIMALGRDHRKSIPVDQRQRLLWAAGDRPNRKALLAALAGPKRFEGGLGE